MFVDVQAHLVFVIGCEEKIVAVEEERRHNLLIFDYFWKSCTLKMTKKNIQLIETWVNESYDKREKERKWISEISDWSTNYGLLKNTF